MARYLLDRWRDVGFIHLEPYRYSVVASTPVLDGSLDVADEANRPELDGLAEPDLALSPAELDPLVALEGHQQPIAGLQKLRKAVRNFLRCGRKYDTGWRLFWIGAATFILSQIGHIPFNAGLTQLFKNGILSGYFRKTTIEKGDYLFLLLILRKKRYQRFSFD